MKYAVQTRNILLMSLQMCVNSRESIRSKQWWMLLSKTLLLLSAIEQVADMSTLNIHVGQTQRPHPPSLVRLVSWLNIFINCQHAVLHIRSKYRIIILSESYCLSLPSAARKRNWHFVNGCECERPIYNATEFINWCKDGNKCACRLRYITIIELLVLML